MPPETYYGVRESVMWGVCDRCQGELVRLSDGMPRLKATGSSQLHTLCRPCGNEVGAVLKQLMGSHIVHAS